MKNRTGITIAALVVAPIVAVSAPAHAQDERHCVSNVERDSLSGLVKRHGYPQLDDLEKHWEVARYGRATVLDGFGKVIAYPRCGYGFDPVDPESGEGFVAVWPDRSGEVRGVVWYRARGARSHGHV